MKGKILNRMRWSWMERGMRPFNCWLLLLLSLLSTWEGVCSQNCSDIQVSPVNTTALKIARSSIAKDLKEINITITIDQVTRFINSGDEEIIGKLKPGTNYNISIHVEYTNGSFNCNLSTATNPSPVTGLNSVKRATNLLTIEWMKPNDTRAVNYTYRITVTNVMDNVSSINYTKEGQTNFTVTGLNPGVEYRLSVESVTPERTLSSPEEVTNTTNPSSVTGLSVVNRTTNSLTIQWTKPTDRRASDYTYKITVTNVMNNDKWINNTKKGETNFTVTDLHPGDQYKLSVESVTPEGTLSSPENVTDTTNPSSVTGLSVVNRTTNSLTIQWTKPTDRRASDYTYKITVTNVMNNDKWINNTKKGETNFTVTDLHPGDQYKLSVESVTPEGTLSSPENVTDTTNPSSVTGLSVVNRTTNSLTIQWTKPTDRRASDYTYKITVTNVMNNDKWINNTKKGETNFTVTDLHPGDQYKLSVESVTPEGTLSSPENVTDTTNPSSVTGLSVVNRTTNSLTIQWTKPTDRRASDYTYKITVTNVMNNDKWINNTKKGETNFTVTDLHPGDQYKLSVESVTPEDTLSSPENVTDTTNPSSVTGLSVVNRTTNSLTIQWTKPTDRRASDYTYKITVTNVMNNDKWINNTKKGETNFTVTDLHPGDQYKLSVESVTPEGTLSSPENVTDTTNPSSVTGLSVVNRTTNSLTIQWTKPTDRRASDYTYKITVTNVMNNDKWINNTKKGETNFTVTDLHPGDQYKLSVESVTPEGTLSSPENVTDTTNPSSVTNLSVVNSTTVSFELKWTAPNDSRASDYTYNITATRVASRSSYRDLNTGVSTSSVTDPGSTEFNVTGLVPGEQYELTVKSVTPENTLSAPVMVTNTTNPSSVTGLSVVNRTTNSLTIQWTKPTDRRASDYTYKVTVTNVMNNDKWINNTKKGETNFTVTDLHPGDQYKLSVESVTPEGTLSSPKNVKNTTNASSVTELNAVERTTISLKIEWIEPSDRRASDYTYRITVTNVMDNHSWINNTKKGETNFTVTDLHPGDQYKLSVESVTPEDTLSSPENVTDTTNPSSVTDLSVVNRTAVSFELKWTAPNDSRASDYTYNITATRVASRSSYRDLNTGVSRSSVTDPGSTEFNVTGLVPGEQYELTVESVTPENTQSAPVMLTNTTIPDTISDFRCAGRTGYTIGVEWNKPKGRFSNFTATASDGDRLLINRTIGKENALSVANLQPGRKYTIKITTVSGQTYSKPEVKECWTNSQPIIIGAIMGSLLGLILIGVLLFFIFYRARRQRKKPDPGSSSMGVLFPEYKPIPLSDYERYFQKKHADTDIGFAEEYQSLANIGTEQSKEASQLPENRTKNRYTNIFPYDAARVKLSQQPDSSSSNYINASYMPGYNLEKAFIAAQGPLPHTVADFWRMIWEQKSNVIVMLTNCIELNRVKCEQYWPMDNRTSVYGDIAVKIISEEILPEWTIRNLLVEKAGCSQPRTVTQMHFTSWPDHGVPNTTDKLLQFQKFVRDHMIKNQGGLPVVHCSAGVGRTGTFIGLDYLMQRVEKESLVDVYGIVRKMRMNRTCMVQTESQYIFLHQCILDSIQQKDVSEPIYENQTDLIYENASAIKAAYNHNQ
ncbi:receptor-type tyrosine-protein phosphatase H-like isoform X2 [Mobula hypostoma]|uniref:receptor-type tyrosine-protein phosphatase H-like isoform X2 n=1 Tax=Mobula hypostoma TaxID=723540 RepID=UPI002FC3501F